MSRNGCGLLALLPALAVLIFACGDAFGQGWSGPEAISSGIRDAETPQVAVGPQGRAVAAFSEYSEIIPGAMSTRVICANLYDGSAWGTAQLIGISDTWDEYDLRVAMDASGNALAAFTEATSALNVYSNHWAGSAWSGAGPVAPGLPGGTSWPMIAMDGSGNAIAVYVEDSTYDIIQASRWDGSAWHQLDTVSWNLATTNADSPGVAMDATGNAIAVWRQYGSPNRVLARHWNGATWGAITPIDMGWPNHALAPEVVMDGSGNALAAFRHNDGADNRACANWWNGSSWSGATTIDTGPGDSVTGLDIALNGRGEALATFVQSDGSKNRVWATLGDGSSWSVPAVIDAGSFGWLVGLYSAPVALDGSGRAVVTFTEYTVDGGVTDIRVWANIWDGSSWAGATAIDFGPGHWADDPQVAIDPSGHALVVFSQRDGSDTRVYVNRYVFPARTSSTWNYDYNGDGTSEIAIFREAVGLWAVRGLTRVYFGRSGDIPAPGDFDGDGTTDMAVFRGSSGLWAARGVTRAYLGGSSDTPLPRDYDGDGTTDIGIFRESTGLWAVRGLTRVYFGAAGDEPISGDFRGYGTAEIGIFRAATGLWVSRAGDRIYFGGSGDIPVLAGYDSHPGLDPAIFRPATGLWAVRGITRAYFGGSADEPTPADYAGGGVAETGVFREAVGLWVVRGLTRVYYGVAGDLPVTR